MSNEEVGTITNRYVTVRTIDWDDGDKGFYVNIISFDGDVDKWGDYEYSHKRSARRAAKTLAKRLDLVYGQEYEYTGEEAPHSFLASK